MARRAIESPTTIAEANTLPHLARSSGPGAVSAFRKLGGVLIAALPSTPQDTARVMELIGDVWPYAAATDTVWSTVLSNYDAIDRVATVVASAGTVEDCTGGMPLWGEEATPAAVNVIEAVDVELLALRQALNSKESRRCREFLAAQGFASDFASDFAPDFAPDHASDFAPEDVPDHASDFAPEDVPCALVLASSLGEAAWVPTPAIDTLVAAASAMLGQDFRAEGRTLATLGLDGLDPGHPRPRRAGRHRADRLRPHRRVPLALMDATHARVCGWGGPRAWLSHLDLPASTAPSDWLAPPAPGRLVKCAERCADMPARHTPTRYLMRYGKCLPCAGGAVMVPDRERRGAAPRRRCGGTGPRGCA